MINEKLYKKVGRKYIEVPMPERYDMSDGIWLVQNKSYSKSFESLMWKVGDLKRPVDIVTHASLQTLTDDLGVYLNKICDPNSEEYLDAKKVCGGYLDSPPAYYNISATDLVTLFLRKIALNLEEGENLSWDDFQYKFRDDIGFDNVAIMDPIEALYAFTEWLKKNNIKFRQNNNIG